MSIREKQMSYIEEFSNFYDNFDKLSYLISLSSHLNTPDSEILTDENLVQGCQSKVWLKVTVTPDEKIYISAYSDTLLIRGFLYILTDLFNGENTADVSHSDITFLNSCGLTLILSENRRSGINAVFKQIQKAAEQTNSIQ